MAFPAPPPSFSTLSTTNIASCCFLLLFSHFTDGAVLVGLKYILHFPTRPGIAHGRPSFLSNQTRCDYSTGSWIRDDSYPLYQSSDCPVIDPEFNCQVNGRPDSDYLKYRWKPAGCELPEFDGLEFVGRMKGKSLMFVGDSLGKNQWESLVCLISAALPRSSPTHIIRGDPLSTFKVLDYSLTILFFKAPYLVDIDFIQGKRVLRLDEISGNGNAWRDVDLLSFNTGHWWTHKGSLQGWDYMQFGGKMHQDMDPLIAMEKGMRTWARWVDSNVDTSKTSVFFLSISPSHYNPSEWGSNTETTTEKNCYGQTEPESGSSGPSNGYPSDCAGQMKVVEAVLESMANPAKLVDITTMSAMRKDCHPSIYGGQHSRTSDCSHWCLPGLPDTWNQLLYNALIN